MKVESIIFYELPELRQPYLVTALAGWPVAARVPPLTIPTLREMGDILRERLKSAVIVLGTVYDNRPYFIAMVAQDLVSKGYHAGEIVKQVAQVTGGSGGGKAHLAQAGGRDKEKLDEALKQVKELLKKQP